MPSSPDGSFGPSAALARGGDGGGNGGGQGHAREVVTRVDRASGGIVPGRKRLEARLLGHDGWAYQDQMVHALTERGWSIRDPLSGSFQNHGERVSTFVALAKELGLDPNIGAMQANHGTFGEIASRISPEMKAAWESLTAARYERIVTTDPRRADALDGIIADLVATLREAVLEADAKPGEGPSSGWETVILDINADGVVDGQDLQDVRAMDREG